MIECRLSSSGTLPGSSGLFSYLLHSWSLLVPCIIEGRLRSNAHLCVPLDSSTTLVRRVFVDKACRGDYDRLTSLTFKGCLFLLDLCVPDRHTCSMFLAPSSRIRSTSNSTPMTCRFSQVAAQETLAHISVRLAKLNAKLFAYTILVSCLPVEKQM